MHKNYYYLCLAANGLDGNGLQLEKIGQFFKFFLCIVQKSLKPDYSLFFLREIPLYFLPGALIAIVLEKKILCPKFEHF